MKHGEVKSHLADYLEGDLSLELRALVDAHLDACPECAEEVDQMLRTIRLLRTLPTPETPPMIADRVMRRIRLGETRPRFHERIGRVLGGVLEPGFVLPASAVAMAALVFFVVQQPVSSIWSGLGLGAEQGGLPLEEAVVQPFSGDGASGRRGGGAAEAPVPRADGVQGRVDGHTWQVVREGSAGNSHRLVGGGQLRFRFDPSTGQGSIEITDSTRPPLRPDVLRSDSMAGERLFAQPMQPALGAPGTMMIRNDLPPAELSSSFDLPGLGGMGPGLAGVSGPLFGNQWSGEESSGGGDPRDAWLARGLHDPAGFAAYLSERNLAEQELWLDRLTDRALELGILENLIRTLRASDVSAANLIADDFVAEARRQSERAERTESER